MNRKYYVIAKYKSKYGLILYCSQFKEDGELSDLDNVFINTFYFKGSQEIKINEVYEFQTIKGENGYTYAFF